MKSLALALVLAAITTTGLARAADPQPFIAFLAPATSYVVVDSTFVVTFQAGSPAEHFNGYTVTIRFDPARVEFVSVAEGSLMAEGAPSRFTYPQRGDSTISYTDVLLGSGLFVDGPGELARFTFRARAAGTSPLDIVSDPHCTFFDAGLCVNDDSTQAFPRTVTLEGATVLIADAPVGAPELGMSGAAPFRFEPNPFRGAGEFVLAARRPGPARLVVVDVAGRAVLQEAWADLSAGPTRFAWTARDRGGRLLPGGVYFARLEDAGGARSLRVVLLH